MPRTKEWSGLSMIESSWAWITQRLFPLWKVDGRAFVLSLSKPSTVDYSSQTSSTCLATSVACGLHCKYKSIKSHELYSNFPYSWTFNFGEDPYGEIDIIEGVMHQSLNMISLHTCGSCLFQQNVTSHRPDCDLHGDSDCMNPQNT